MYLNRLEEALASKKWELANLETTKVITRIAGLPSANSSPVLPDFITARKLAKLSCEQLMAIDSLWMEYSQGHFGFTVQAQTVGAENMATDLKQQPYDPQPFLDKRHLQNIYQGKS